MYLNSEYISIYGLAFRHVRNLFPKKKPPCQCISCDYIHVTEKRTKETSKYKHKQFHTGLRLGDCLTASLFVS